MVSTGSTLLRRAFQAAFLAACTAGGLLWLIRVHHVPQAGPVWYLFTDLFATSLPKMAWVGAFLVLGYGIGRLVLSLVRADSALDTLEDDLLYSIATGWGLIGLAAFLLGSLGILQVSVHVFLGLAAAGLAWRQYAGFWKRLKASRQLNLSAVEVILLLAVITIALWGIPYSLVPEWGFDSLNSHLPAPRTYLEEGRISFHPEINFNNFPQTVEMWFMESMMLIPWRNGTAAPLLMNTCHLLTALTVFAMGRRFFGRGAGLAAALVYLLIRKVYLFATLAFIDQGLAFMTVLGSYAVFRYIERPARPLALLAGIAFGFACGIKYSALISVAVMGLTAVVLEAFGERKWLRLLSDILLALAVMLLTACPWYIRNWVWFHNPFFPFFSDMFPPGGTYLALLEDLKVDHSEMLRMFVLPGGKNFIGFLLLPITLAFNPFGPYDHPQNTGALGPWFLMSLPLLLFVRRFPRMLWAFSLSVVATFAYWWFGEGMLHLRYMLPVFSMMAVFTGFTVWEALKLDKVRLNGIATSLAGAAVLAGAVTFFTGYVVPEQVKGKFPLGEAEKRQFAVEQMGPVSVVEALNDSLAKSGILKEARVYGFFFEQCRWAAEFKLIGNQVGYADHEDYLRHATDAETLYNWLRRYNIHFLIVNTPYAVEQLGERAMTADPANLPGWEQYFEIVGVGDINVYALILP